MTNVPFSTLTSTYPELRKQQSNSTIYLFVRNLLSINHATELGVIYAHWWM